jgi:predicted transcriptional regulator
MRVNIRTDGFEAYAKRALARARKLDRKVPIRAEMTITFDDPLAMVEVLTAERLRLLTQLRVKPLTMSALAATLNRDTRSVRRDVSKLEYFGVLRTREQVNPGHGRVKIVEPIARRYKLMASL